MPIILEQTSPSRPWTDKDDALLRELYLTHSRQEIANQLQRTDASVRSRCSRLSLNSKKEPQWSEAEKMRVMQWYVERASVALEDFQLDVLAAELGRPKTSICYIAHKLGLTDQYRSVGERGRKAMSKRAIKWLSENPHPRGFLGGHHSEEMKAAQGAKLSFAFAQKTKAEVKVSVQKAIQTKIARYGTGRPGKIENAHSRARRGKRDDLNGQFFRSSWEANYARYLNHQKKCGLIQGWTYESETFYFDGKKDGIYSYKPDFFVVGIDGAESYHEVKGWMTDKGKKQIKKFRKHHPEKTFYLIGEKEYREIEAAFRQSLENWEVSK